MTAWAQARSYHFDISNQTLSQALRTYGEVSGEEIIFTEDVVAGLAGATLKGDFTAEAALRKLLEGTGLIAERAPSGALMILRRSSRETGGAISAKPSDVGNPRALSGDLHLAQAGTSPTDASGSQDVPAGSRATSGADEPVKIEEVMIRGRKIDGLNNQGLLQSGEDAALYHDVVTAKDIERLGVSSLEELFRLIPQTSSATTSLQGSVGNTQTSGGLTNQTSTIGLRGFSSSQTVILVNGRALPRTGIFQDGGADLDRIPLAAIDRIEILPYAGSAIYGAGAIGGAINIVLRKEYSGNDLSAYVGTTTDGGGTEERLTYVGGKTFNEGKTNLTTTVSYQHRDALRASDRDYLDEALQRYGPDSTAVNAQGVPLFETLVLPAFASAPGTILVGNPPGAPNSDLGIPGAPGVRFAAIPTGTTAGQALTPASFTATAGQANLAPRYGRSILYQPLTSYNINTQWGHDFTERLQAYGELTLGYNRMAYSAPQGLVLNLSDTDPLNPFRTNVTPGFVGRPVTILLDTPDLSDPSFLQEDKYARTVIGLKGKLTDRWEWSADGVFDYSRSTADSNNPIDNLTSLTALTPSSDPGPAADAATRRAIYPILADHAMYPVSSATAASYFDSVRDSFTRSRQWEGNARILGTVFDLPAGPFQTSVVGKYQYWDFNYGQRLWASNAWSQLVNNAPSSVNASSTPASRKVFQGGLEISIPIISSLWRPVPIESLELQGSISRERHVSSSIDDNGDPFSNTQSANSRVIAVRLQLTQDVAFRSSYSEGFYPPDWDTVGQPVTKITLPGFFADPARGNTLQFFSPGAPMISVQSGGNPNLRPEAATSENFGVILTPRWLPGLSVHVDYWRIEKTDAVVSVSFTDMIANPAAYGFLVTRAAPTAEDLAKGWLGYITAIDARAFNASVTRTRGVDLKVRYTVDAASLGTFDFLSSGSFTNNFDVLPTPTAPAVDTVSGSGPVRWRANASLAWLWRNWSTTLTSRYTGSHSTTTTAPSASYPGAFPLDGSSIPGFLRWDLQLGYEVPAKTASQGPMSWLAGTRFTLGAINLFDAKPAFVSDGYSFYNSLDDPRQRIVYLQIKKSF